MHAQAFIQDGIQQLDNKAIKEHINNDENPSIDSKQII
jgi:hypothetical protein